MNNAEIYLTPAPVSLSGQGTQQLPLNQAVNVLSYDQADLSLVVYALTATTSPTCDVEIWTGMQTNTMDGWYKAANWAQVTSGSSVGIKLGPVTGLQKYVIWKVTLGAGSGTPACTFYIAGVLRQI